MTFRKKLMCSFIVFSISSSILTGCSQNTNTDKVTTTTNITETAYNGIFKANEVMDIKIELSEKDWKDMKENAFKEEYHQATITVGDTKVENVKAQLSKV